MQVTLNGEQLLKGWEEKRLSDISTLLNGYSFKSEDFSVKNSIQSVKITNVGVGEFIQESSSLLPEAFLTKYSEFKVSKNDIVIALTRSIISTGLKISLVPDEYDGALLNQRVAAIKPNHNDILTNFLFLYFCTPNVSEYVRKEANTLMQPNLSIRSLRNLLVPIPPILEQKRIVSIVDQAFEGIDRAIANTQKNLANARELFESYLNAIFDQKGDGWEEKTLREVSLEFGRGKSKHRPRNDPKLYGGSYPFIQTGDVRNCNHFITKNSQFYSEAGLAQSKLWTKGTICITIAANIAETGILGFDACFPDSVIGIVVNHELTSNDFVEYLLQAVKARIKAKGKGSAQDNINLATFENEKFPFPSLDQQRVIVDNLDQLSSETQRLETIYQQKLVALNELKQAILQKAFTGELTADTANQATETAKEVVAA